MNKLTATAYLQVVEDGPFRAKVVRVTQTYPRQPEPGSVIVKVKVTLPQMAFKPLHGEVEIPLDQIQYVPDVDSDDAHPDEVEATT